MKLIRSRSEHAPQNFQLGIKRHAVKRPKPTVDVIVSKNKLEETKTKEFILSFTRQEIRSGTTVQRRKRFKQAIRNIKPSNGSS